MWSQLGDSATRYFLIKAMVVVFVGFTMVINHFTFSDLWNIRSLHDYPGGRIERTVMLHCVSLPGERQGESGADD